MIDQLEIKKAASLLEKAGTIFVALPEEVTADTAVAAAILAGRLAKLGKEVAVSSAKPLPPKWEFLPIGSLASSAPIPREIFITVDAKNSPVGELRYEKDDEALTITLSPKDKPIRASDIKISEGPAKAECVIVIGAGTLDRLGALYHKNPRLFFETPIINIDISPTNDHFGEANLVNSKARALTEISWQLAKTLLPRALTEDEATLVLAGILSSTNNFLDGKVLPETLALAAESISAGAKRELILKAIEEHRPLPLLQLWGRAAVRSRYDEDRGIFISIITAEDFIKTGTTPDSFSDIVRLFETHFAPPKVFILFLQDPETKRVFAILQSRDLELVKELQRALFGIFERGMLRARETFPSFRDAETSIFAVLASLGAGTHGSDKVRRA